MKGEVFAPAAKGLGVSVVLYENTFDCDVLSDSSTVNTFAENGAAWLVFPWPKFGSVAAAPKGLEGTLGLLVGNGFDWVLFSENRLVPIAGESFHGDCGLLSELGHLLGVEFGVGRFAPPKTDGDGDGDGDGF